MTSLRACILALALAIPTAVAQAGEACPGDIDGSGLTDFQDLLLLLSQWDCEGCPSDLNGNGVTEFQDLLLLLADWDCQEPQGAVTSLSGNVTNLWTGDPIEGATVTVGEDVVLTDEFGDYTGDFPVGIHLVMIEADNFLAYEDELILFPDLPVVLDAALEPVAAVVVTIETTGDTEPGGTVMATAVVEVLDGSTIQGYMWSQLGGTPANLVGADMETVEVGLGATIDYKTQLVHVLAEPPIAPEDLPPNIPPPDGEFPGGLQDRWQVVGMSPWALEEAGLVTLGVEVTTTSGVYDADDEVHSPMPWQATLGHQNVPRGVPVLMGGKEQASYDWVLTPPFGSGATLIDPTTQYPEFTPDNSGAYDLTVTDLATAETVEIRVWTDSYVGVIIDQDVDGRPIPDPACTSCHSNITGNEDIFPQWSQSGHAEIFTNNLNTSTHYGSNCFPCHTVGFYPDAFNGGFDDAPDYQAFLDSGMLNNPGDNWTTMLADFPQAARLANIQCENCHGPQSEGHHQPDEPRITLSSDGCAVCHGEPPRHGRYQQWQLSGHANYELAIDESGSGNCSRCHTANGFLAWLPILLGDEPGDPNDSVTVTWTADESHPQTCATCHDPHAVGTTSGLPNNATVRISGNTPPLIAGFTAYGVGRGAVCMTCHNSRRGLRNDSTFDDFYGTSEAARAPHGSSQTDMLMGENSYLTTVGFRGNHSFLDDTCVKCHMESTPPPADVSYNQSGTNHTFFASADICADCHVGEPFTAESIQEGVQETLDILQGLIEENILNYIGVQTALGNVIDLNEEIQIADVALVADILFGEYRGRQAITVTFTDDSVFGPYRISDITILDADLVYIEDFYDSADPALIKAGWNWALVNNDGSLGVHNPSYAYLVLTPAISGLDPLAAIEMPEWLDLNPVKPRTK